MGAAFARLENQRAPRVPSTTRVRVLSRRSASAESQGASLPRRNARRRGRSPSGGPQKLPQVGGRLVDDFGDRELHLQEPADAAHDGDEQEGEVLRRNVLANGPGPLTRGDGGGDSAGRFIEHLDVA